MLSSDKNVETIAQLIEVLKHYLGLQTEYLKLDVIDKVVRLMKAATLALIFILIIVAVVMYFSFALAFWLSNFMGMTKAFLIVGAVHLLIFILFVIFRKPWIEKPLVHFLAGLLLTLTSKLCFPLKSILPKNSVPLKRSVSARKS